MTFIQRLIILQTFDFKTLKRPHPWLFMAGLLSALAFEPFGLDLWVLAPAFCFLLSISDRVSLKKAFKQGWFFGLGHYMGGLYWIAISLTVDFKQFFWLFPLAVGAIPSILALLSATTLLITNALPVRGWVRGLTFCFFWCGFEWIRGHFWGGFPWNSIGYVWASCPQILQSTSILGVYGLGLLTLIMAVLTFDKRGLWISGLMGVGLWLFGLQRLQTPTTMVPHVMLRLVQPCIKQELKWQPNQREAILQKLCQLSKSVSLKVPTHIIWPESAAVFDAVHDPVTLRGVAKILPPQVHLIFGAPHIQRHATGRIEKLWNSIFSLNAQADLTFIYDKNHLVPFGEYLPFRTLMPAFIDKVTPGSIDYSKGTGLKTVVMPSLPPFSPTICYEIIFAGKVATYDNIPPQWILNLTNDAWFGRSTGPYQHLAMARTRAVETGLPLVRSANNGISTVIDGHGRTLQQLGLNEAGIIDSPLPKPLPTTLYTRYGDTFFFALMTLLGFILMFMITVRPKLKRPGNMT